MARSNSMLIVDEENSSIGNRELKLNYTDVFLENGMVNCELNMYAVALCKKYVSKVKAWKWQSWVLLALGVSAQAFGFRGGRDLFVLLGVIAVVFVLAMVLFRDNLFIRQCNLEYEIDKLKEMAREYGLENEVYKSITEIKLYAQKSIGLTRVTNTDFWHYLDEVKY